MYNGPPTDRIEEGTRTAYGYKITYAIDIELTTPLRRKIHARVHHGNGHKFIFATYNLEPTFFNKLLRQTRPIPEDTHLEEVLGQAKSYAKKLATKRADARDEELEPSLIVGTSVRHD